MKDPAGEEIIRLAARILRQKMKAGGPPATLEDIARLRFLAETGAERDMPVEELARAILVREARRAGYEIPARQIKKSNSN